MAEELNKQSPSTPPTTEVNQYGDHPMHIGNVENLSMNVYMDRGSDSYDESGRPLTPIVPTRFDSTTRVIYLGTEQIKLPVQLTPMSVLSSQELPYINALCEVYAEKLQRAITPDVIDTLPGNLRRFYADQRKAYYSAESVHRSVREVFAEGEAQFSALKEDAYEGISTTYYDDRHQSGYERLQAVLEKITSTTLTKSALMNIVGMIGNLEKKGICHMLVNDDVIKSWVNIDE
ncbi:MAG: hypothetical protein IJV41_01725 [Oscillospiraceae bacterium]|nr:hypothetical protein [Oscillospiraceae bacterium]